MNVENIKVGETYKYKELCNLLGVKCETATNKRMALYDDFHRYFDYEKINKQDFLIKDIYEKPLAGFENGFFYKLFTNDKRSSSSLSLFALFDVSSPLNNSLSFKY